MVVEGPKQVYYSLARATTDSNGAYTVVLPTAPSAPDGGTGSPDGG